MARHSLNQLTVQEIADLVKGRIKGTADRLICGVEVTTRASGSDLTFISDAKKASWLKSSDARVVLAPASAEVALEKISDTTFVLVEEPEYAFLLVAKRLHPRRETTGRGISRSAVLESSATIGHDSTIGHHATVGHDVTIGTGCQIGAGVVIGDGCTIGDNVVIHPNAVLYSDVIVGSNVIIHANCVLGADGFGYRTVNGHHERLPHFGIVRICDDVEIGAGTTIDRAKVGETIIGSGTRIDNQVMIGHNCHIGEHNLIVSQVGFAGSVTTGAYVVVAGQVGIADHVQLGDGTVIGAQAGVHRDLKGGQSYIGSPVGPFADTTRQLMALRRLPELRDTVRQLRKDVAQLQQRHDNSAPSSTSDVRAA